MKKVIWILLALLVVLHQLDPFGANHTLIFGFLPIILLYHVGISLAAGITWWLTVCYAWPSNLTETTVAAASSRTEDIGQ